MERNNFVYIGKGALRGFIVTAVLIAIMAVITNFANINPSITSVAILIITMVSIIYGAIYATKKIRKKGWVVGILVAALYIIILYIASLIAGRESVLAVRDLWRGLLALAVGALSGMLGINL